MEARSIGGTRVNAKKPQGPNFHLRIAAESQQNRSIVKTDDYWCWKVSHLRQQQAKTVVVEWWWTSASGLSVRNVRYPMANLLIRISIFNNWIVWSKQSPRSGQLWAIGEELCSNNNEKQHVLIVTRQQLRGVGWEILMQTSYSPALAISNCYLFLFMANDFVGEKFASITLNMLNRIFNLRQK